MVLEDDPEADVPAVRSLEYIIMRDTSEKRFPRRVRVLRGGGDIQGHPGQDAVGHGQIDEASLPRGRPVHQRGGNGQRGVQARGQVRNQNGRDRGRIAASQQTTDREIVDVMTGAVPVGAFLAEPRNGAIHDGGIEVFYRRVVYAEPSGHARPESLQHDVRPSDQAAHDLPARFLFQIDHDIPLAAVDTGESRWKTAQGISAGRLHLDHTGAEIGEQHGAVGTRQLRGQLQDEVVGQRGNHGCSEVSCTAMASPSRHASSCSRS